jgi:serine/threonine-protein kinase
MKFGQYELLERIAMGGMAEVYKGRVVGAEGFEKLVAIKRILPDLAEDERFVTMLLTEARIHSALSHRNIVQIHDLGMSEEGEYFIVLEYVEGYDLRAITESFAADGEIIPEALSLHIAAEVAQALHFAHELRGPNGHPLGLIHRDVSPSNVLISFAGEVKLSDFGLAKRRDDRSVVGSLKGNLIYMSPEQARQGPLDRRSDVFSLGAILFELLTGHRLREITDEIRDWSEVAAGVVRSPRSVRPDLPESFEALLTQALAADPNRRFPTAGAFGAAIRQLLSQMNMPVGPSDLQALLGLVTPPRRPRGELERSKVIRLAPEANPLRSGAALRPPPERRPPSAALTLGVMPPFQPPPGSLAAPPSSGAPAAAPPPPVLRDEDIPPTPLPGAVPAARPRQPTPRFVGGAPVAPPPPRVDGAPRPRAATGSAPTAPPLRVRQPTPDQTTPPGPAGAPTAGSAGAHAARVPTLAAPGGARAGAAGGLAARVPTLAAPGGGAAGGRVPTLAAPGGASMSPGTAAPPLHSGAARVATPYGAAGMTTPPGAARAPTPFGGAGANTPPGPAARASSASLGRPAVTDFPPDYWADRPTPPGPIAAASPPAATPPAATPGVTPPPRPPATRAPEPPVGTSLGGWASAPEWASSAAPPPAQASAHASVHAPWNAPAAPPAWGPPAGGNGGPPVADWSPPAPPAGWGNAPLARTVPLAAPLPVPPPPRPTVSAWDMVPPGDGVAQPRRHHATDRVALPSGGRWRLVLLGVATLLLAAATAVHLAIVPLDVLYRWGAPAVLYVASEPEGAVVKLDGVSLPDVTPTRVPVKRDRFAHVLEVGRPGFHSAHELVRYDRSVTLSEVLTLQPDESAPSARGSAPASDRDEANTASATAGEAPAHAQGRGAQ